jgi:hypothetical protein
MPKKTPPSRTAGFIRAGDLLPGFEALAPAVQEIEQKKALTPQGRHHFNRLRQIDALATVGETQNPDMGFMTRLLSSTLSISEG